MYSVHTVLKKKSFICWLSCVVYVCLEDQCCRLKEVGGVKYKFVDIASEGEKLTFGCSNNCVYENAEKETEQRFCFRSGNLESTCAESKIGKQLDTYKSGINIHVFTFYQTPKWDFWKLSMLKMIVLKIKYLISNGIIIESFKPCIPNNH